MYPIKTPIYQSVQIREIERQAAERFNIVPDVLMQRAGKAAFDFMLRRWPQAQHICVFCGAGNNGGDGYVVAHLAHERGLKVSVWQLGNHDHLPPAAKKAYEACARAGVKIAPFQDKADLEHPDLIVDAICGIGLHDDLRDDVVKVIKKIQRLRAPIFSIDIPTGIDADTGHLLGAAVQATATMTFIGLKMGLLTGNGIAYTGELAVNDLQLPTDLFTYVQPVAEKIHLASFSAYLKPRLRDWHKGLSGHVLVIGGEAGFTGAPRMAAEAALRVGAGLVSVATRPESVIAMNAEVPEIMCHGVGSVEALEPLAAKADVIVIGPGLGQTEWARALWAYVSALSKPLVVDADALNILAERPQLSDYWILTPHPGEAARLMGASAQMVQYDRLEVIKAIQKKFGGVCILKGAGTLVLAPSALPALCDKGNPGMASAGMGDVLSGVLGGLLAQGVPLGEAAKLGVVLHAMAGDMAAKEGERGMVATDLMPHLRRLCNLSKQG